MPTDQAESFYSRLKSNPRLATEFENEFLSWGGNFIKYTFFGGNNFKKRTVFIESSFTNLVQFKGNTFTEGLSFNRSVFEDTLMPSCV